jgi:hypothetical protein
VAAAGVGGRLIAMDRTPMEPHLVTEDRLLRVLEELQQHEPLFHRRNLVSNRAEFERETAEDFWEVAASGRRFSREYVWAVLKERYESSDADEFEVEGWELRDFHLREIAPTVYLLTYTLWGQGDRLTRRLSVWTGSPQAGWKVLYHQGTVAATHDRDLDSRRSQFRRP